MQDKITGLFTIAREKRAPLKRIWCCQLDKPSGKNAAHWWRFALSMRCYIVFSLLFAKQMSRCRSRSRSGLAQSSRRQRCGKPKKKRSKCKKWERSRVRQPYIGTRLSTPYLSSKFVRWSARTPTVSSRFVHCYYDASCVWRTQRRYDSSTSVR